MPRFYYTIAQKLYILDLVRAGQIFRLHTEFANVTQKQIDDWNESEQEMRALSDKEKNSKLTLHKGPTVKYRELYQFLYQTDKEMRSERLAVTVDSLIGIARNECAEVLELSHEGRISLIRRFMSYFKLSIRETTDTSGFREEQASEDQLELCETFRRRFRQIIAQKLIPIQNVFNMDQTGVNYENPPSRTVDFIGNREVPIQTQGGEKKRLTLFSLLNATGTLFPQLAVLKGAPEGRVHEEVREYDDEDEHTIHTVQRNAWCSELALQEWHQRIWRPIAEGREGSKLLVVDSYPLHVDATQMLSWYDTTVLFVPTGLTFSLQPLDCGFFKVLKDELKKLWIRDFDFKLQHERDRRAQITEQVKECWHIMAKKDLSVYWERSQLLYPFDDVEYLQRELLMIASQHTESMGQIAMTLVEEIRDQDLLIEESSSHTVSSHSQNDDPETQMDQETEEKSSLSRDFTGSQLFSQTQDSKIVDESVQSQSCI